MGITEDVFWNLSVKTIKPYIKAHTLKRREQNFISWQQGLYNCQAFSIVAANIMSGFSRGNRETFDYPERPFVEFDALSKSEYEAYLQEEKDKEVQKLVAFLGGIKSKTKLNMKEGNNGN